MNILSLLHQTVTQLTEEQEKNPKNIKLPKAVSIPRCIFILHCPVMCDALCTSVTTLQDDPSQGRMMSAKQGSYFRIDYYFFASFETKF